MVSLEGSLGYHKREVCGFTRVQYGVSQEGNVWSH